MNLGEMIDVVSTTKGITKAQAKQDIMFYFGSEGIIAGVLKEKESVKLGEIGTLKTVERAERKGRNPQTQEEIIIPAKTAVVFKASKELQNNL